jgi:hypothetical protein
MRAKLAEMMRSTNDYCWNVTVEVEKRGVEWIELNDSVVVTVGYFGAYALMGGCTRSTCSSS